MKKILFSLVALVAAMSMNAQVMKVYKNGAVVASYTGAQLDSIVMAPTYNVFFSNEPHRPEGSDFSGYETSTLTAGNSDVSISFALSGNTDAMWNEGGNLQVPGGGTLTVTVTPQTGVDVSEIALLGDDNPIIRTGAGPWRFTVNDMGWILDGSNHMMRIMAVAVIYTK